jgi:hypothetical protein
MNTVLVILLIGIASQYSPGVMERTIAVRQRGRTAYTVPTDLSRYDGFIAMESRKQLGNEYYLRPVGTEQWELFLVVDCSGHSSTSAWMKRNNIIAEVDYETAKRWGTIGKGIEIELAVMVDKRYLPQ